MRRLLFSLLCGASLAVSVAAQRAPTVVILVRHAEKATVPANDPPLTEAGAARARALAAALSDANVAAVIATSTIRTRETARPTAEARGLTVETVATGSIPAHARAVADAVLKHAGKTVLVVGHSNTIAAIITALGGPKMADLCDTQYSMLFTLVLHDGQATLVRSTYGTPTPDTPESCPAMAK